MTPSNNEIHDNTTTTPAHMEQNPSDESLGQKAFKGHDTPCSIHIKSIRKRLADADGVSGKAAIDGLVHAGILQNDSAHYVKEVSYSQEKGSPEETIITLSWEDDNA